MISVDKLTKRFDGHAVLDELTLSLAKGKLTAICGPSGCGKSTLLRCIVGLERFDSGTIRVGDLALPAGGGRARDEIAHAIRLHAGIVFQHFGLFAHMTVLENVIEAPMHVRGDMRSAAVERADALLDRFGLTKRRDAYPRELSGGEKQRVAIARALAMSPEALLLDEPTSALDPKRKGEVADLLASIARDGTTVVVVTHEHALARAAADEAIVLEGGRVAAAGPPEKVLISEG